MVNWLFAAMLLLLGRFFIPEKSTEGGGLGEFPDIILKLFTEALWFNPSRLGNGGGGNNDSCGGIVSVSVDSADGGGSGGSPWHDAWAAAAAAAVAWVDTIDLRGSFGSNTSESYSLTFSIVKRRPVDASGGACNGPPAGDDTDFCDTL